MYLLWKVWKGVSDECRSSKQFTKEEKLNWMYFVHEMRGRMSKKCFETMTEWKSYFMIFSNYPSFLCQMTPRALLLFTYKQRLWGDFSYFQRKQTHHCKGKQCKSNTCNHNKPDRNNIYAFCKGTNAYFILLFSKLSTSIQSVFHVVSFSFQSSKYFLLLCQCKFIRK